MHYLPNTIRIASLALALAAAACSGQRSPKQQQAFDLGYDWGRDTFSEAGQKMSPSDAKEMAQVFASARNIGTDEFDSFYAGIMKAYHEKYK